MVEHHQWWRLRDSSLTLELLTRSRVREHVTLTPRRHGRQIKVWNTISGGDTEIVHPTFDVTECRPVEA